MSLRFRPRLDALEARDVPASLSFQLPDGSTSSAQFSTPAGVDPAESWQQIELTDLTVSHGGVEYTVAPVPFAYYASGVLVGVVANAFSATNQIDLSFGTAALTPIGTTNTEYGSIADDGADTQATFTLPDGTTGSISYAIPWESVDPDLATQSVALTAFNLNIAGRNFAYGSASFTTAPTLQFEYGEFKGASFAIDTSATAGFAYSSISQSGMNITAVPIGGGQPMFAAAPVIEPALVINFSTYNSTGTAHTLRVRWKLSDGTDTLVQIPIPAGTAAGDVRSLVASVLEDNGLKISEPGETRLRVKGTAAGKLTEVRFDVINPPMGWNGPKLGGRMPAGDITPKLFINGTEQNP